jgi:site-specific DNA-methyltransferase (adenine-specific)
MTDNRRRLFNENCISGAQTHIADDSVDLIITDPPYGINGDQLHRHYNRSESPVIKGYIEVPASEYATFSRDWICQAERVLRPGGSLYIVSGYSNLRHILNALAETNLTEQNHIIWKYNFGVYTKNKYVSSHYHILYYTKPGGQVTFNTFARFGSEDREEDGGSLNYRDREDVWLVNREYKPGQVKNKNELPEELLIKIMQYSSNEGDLVCDFFLGGFSTARIAIGLNRRVTGFELNKISFTHHLSETAAVPAGFLLASLQAGSDQRPKRQGAAWSEEEIQQLQTRYQQVFGTTRNKRRAIGILQDEFQRGYFAILNKLNPR